MYQKLLSLEEEVLKTLANQKRLEILQLLKSGRLNVTEMTQMLGLPQPNLSQHLSLLRQHGLVKVTKNGQRVYYELANNKVTRAVELIYEFLKDQQNIEYDFSKDKPFPIVKDPVCGMRLSASEAFDSLSHNGEEFYFCASGCKHKFEANPKKYVKHTKELRLS
jgi:ArsR family transcriptional regulator, virulence genes transcriptional regulator